MPMAVSVCPIFPHSNLASEGREARLAAINIFVLFLKFNDLDLLQWQSACAQIFNISSGYFGFAHLNGMYNFTSYMRVFLFRCLFCFFFWTCGYRARNAHYKRHCRL